MHVDPRHRYLAVLAAANEALPAPEDPLEAALYALASSGSCPDPNVSYAYDLYALENHRAAMDAFLLSKVPPELIAGALEIPPLVIAAYRHLFMDTDVFRNRLELVTYAADYEGNAYAKELVRTAVLIGCDYLLWAFGKPDPALDNRAVVRRTMVDAFFRGMAHKGNPITSATVKEAQKWWANAIRNAQILEDIDPRTAKSALEDLRLALGQMDETLSTDEAPVPVEDILH